MKNLVSTLIIILFISSRSMTLEIRPNFVYRFSEIPQNCVLLLQILAIIYIVDANPPQLRPHSVSILEFGAIGDGKTVNTLAFQNAIFYLKSFADKGGAQLYIPEGRWLTGSFNLTSHLTLFLEKNAVILGSPVRESFP